MSMSVNIFCLRDISIFDKGLLSRYLRECLLPVVFFCCTSLSITHTSYLFLYEIWMPVVVLLFLIYIHLSIRSIFPFFSCLYFSAFPTSPYSLALSLCLLPFSFFLSSHLSLLTIISCFLSLLIPLFFSYPFFFYSNSIFFALNLPVFLLNVLFFFHSL